MYYKCIIQAYIYVNKRHEAVPHPIALMKLENITLSERGKSQKSTFNVVSFL